MYFIWLAFESGFRKIPNLDIAKLLIDNRIDIYSKDEFGISALHLACQYGLLDIVKLFDDLNCKTNLNDTPLHKGCIWLIIKVQTAILFYFL